MLFLFALLRRRVESIPFFPVSFFLHKSLHSGGVFNCHYRTLNGIQGIFQTVVKMYSIYSFPPTSFPSMTLTLLFFFIVSLAATSLFLSLPSCLWKMLQNLGYDDLQFPILFLFLQSAATISFLFPSISGEVIGMTLMCTSIHTVLLQRNTPLSIFPLQLYFNFLVVDEAKCVIPFSRVQSQPKVWWS